MKRWVQKFIHQFEVEDDEERRNQAKEIQISDDRATVLFVIDTLSKYLFDLDHEPARKTRSILEELGQDLVKSEGERVEKSLFRFRQFYSSYRISEYTYIQKTFDDFRKIIWDFVEQLNEDLETEQEEENLKEHFEELKEAVEANSIEALKRQSRQFIDSYVEYQFRKDQKKSESILRFQKNLSAVKKQLVEANQNMRLDHLTKAFNRKSFDEHINKQMQLSRVSNSPASLVMLDIDHFKKVNDNYGHAVGDTVLIECVNMLKEAFNRDEDFVARVGGEEFAVVMGECNINQAVHKVEKAMKIIRDAVYVHEEQQIRFTISAGIAVFQSDETLDVWMKRADEALYTSKNNGRNRYTIAETKEEEKAS